MPSVFIILKPSTSRLHPSIVKASFSNSQRFQDHRSFHPSPRHPNSAVLLASTVTALPAPNPEPVPEPAPQYQGMGATCFDHTDYTITDSHAYWGPVALADGQTTQTRTHALSESAIRPLSASPSQSEHISISTCKHQPRDH